MDEKIKNSILKLLDKHIKDANDGYNSIHSEYWFGRLCECEDIKKEILVEINLYRFNDEILSKYFD